MKKHRIYLHYLGLVGAIALGAIFRLWDLDLKPLWMDEITTAIFSLGKNFRDLPLDRVIPLNQVEQIFKFQPGISCAQIAENLANQSTHPPLFFCIMYSWLAWLHPLGTEWVAKLRSFPMLCGIGTILAIYAVNRLAFSPTSGIMAGLVMAISPFAVYLSQEARHYTLPMLLITLSLWGLIQIQQDIFQHSKIRFWVWLLWAIINIIGLYVHYFFAIAFIAEIVTLLLLIYRYQSQLDFPKKRRILLILSFYIGGIIISFIPWLSLIFNHFRGSETNWLPPAHDLSPLYQTLMDWVLMLVIFPVENQPLAMTIFSGTIMIVFSLWVGWLTFTNLKFSRSGDTTYSLAIFTLLSFTICILLQFFIIAYFLGKDITAIPRYNFVYYPSFCALIGAGLERIRNTKKIIFLLVGILSCSCVVTNLAFEKPFAPEQVAQKMNLDPKIPVMIVGTYDNNQDISLGLSFALALEKLRSHNINSPSDVDRLALLRKDSNLTLFQQNLRKISLPSLSQHLSQLNLWIVAPGLLKRDFEPQLKFNPNTTCYIDPSQHYRIGIPYQLYRCIQK